MKRIRAFARTTLLIATVIVSACAQNQVFREGMRLYSEGRIEEGLARLELASRESPNNIEYRSTWFRQRALAVAQMLMQAETARATDDLGQAEAIYRRVLNIDRVNDRAKAGLEEIQAARRHRALVEEAEGLLKKGDRGGAERKIRTVLTENPNQREARAVQRRIEEAKLKETLAAKTLKPNLKRPITLDFRDASLQAIFQAIARASGVNYVFDRDVRSDLRATIQLKNKNIDDAVKVLLVTNQLDQKVIDEDTVIVYPNLPAKQREYQELTVKAFYLANADAKLVLNTIRSIVKTRDIVYDEKLNLLIMRDTPEAVRTAEKLVALQDQAEPEVVLALEVMEVSATRLQELGIRFPEQVSYGIVGSANTPGTVTLREWNNRDSSLVRLSVTNPALIVNLRKLDTDTNLLANPHVRVRNREKARIHIGERVPVITTISTANVGVSESVSYLDVGLKLEIEPTIYLEDEVAMKVALEVSSILDTIVRASGTQVYRLGTRNAATTLRLKDGETQILAGLIQSDERRTANKIPGIGDLPIVGRLFSNRNDNNTKTEIVLLITPRIVRNIVRPEVDIAEFASGTEASLGGGAPGAGVPFPIPFVPRSAPPTPPSPAPKPPLPVTPGTQSIPTPFFPQPTVTPGGVQPPVTLPGMLQPFTTPPTR